MFIELLVSVVLLLGGENESVVQLKNGKQIFGIVVERTLKTVKIKRRGMTIEILADDIRSIKEMSKHRPVPEKGDIEKKPDPLSEKKRDEQKKIVDGDKNDGTTDFFEKKDIKTLIVEAINDEFKDLKPLWEVIKDDPIRKLKTHLPKPSLQETELILKLITTQFEEKYLSDVWIWYLRITDKKMLAEGLKFLESDKNRPRALRCCLVALAYNKDELSLNRLQYGCKAILKVVDEQELATLKKLVLTRTKVGPLDNRIFAAKIIIKHDWKLEMSDWKYLLTHKTDDIRKIAVEYALRKDINEVSRDSLESFYLEENDEDKKTHLLRLLNNIPFTGSLNMKFLKSIQKDSQFGKSKPLRQNAFNQLKSGSGNSWQPKDPRWKQYFKNDVR